MESPTARDTTTAKFASAFFDRVAVVELNPLHTQEFETVPTVVDRMTAVYGAAFDTSSPP
jgi:hypothetical protein